MLKYKGHIIERAENSIIIDSKRVKVIENRKYTYKINKRSISAQGGADGLYMFLKDLIENDFARVWIEAVINGVSQITNRSSYKGE